MEFNTVSNRDPPPNFFFLSFFWQTGQIDVSNFDSEFTSEAPMDSVVTDSALSETVQDQFKGFTYIPANEYIGESVQHGSVMS